VTQTNFLSEVLVLTSWEMGFGRIQVEGSLAMRKATDFQVDRIRFPDSCDGTQALTPLQGGGILDIEVISELRCLRSCEPSRHLYSMVNIEMTCDFALKHLDLKMVYYL